MKDKKFSILFIANQLIYGGAERYTIYVANEMAKRGYKVSVISKGGPMMKLIAKDVKHYFAPTRGTDILSRAKTVLTIVYVSLKEGVDIIHTQSTSTSLAARIAKIITRTPIVKTAHGYPEGRFPTVARTLNYTTDKVVMISDWLSERLISFGLKRSKAITILNGVDVEKFSNVKTDRSILRSKLGFSEKDKVIVSVSRIVPEKQLEQLIAWFPYVLAKEKAAKLLIVGDEGADGSAYKDSLIKQAKKLGLFGETIVFLKGTDKVAEVLKMADIFCTPSVGKGFAVLEAMAAGLPVVARKPKGVADTVIDGVNGFLFSAGDWVLMSERIVYLLQSKDVSKKFGEQGKILVSSSFTLDQMITKLEKLYLKLLKSGVPAKQAVTSPTLKSVKNPKLDPAFD